MEFIRLDLLFQWQLDENASSSAALQSHFSSGMVSPNLPYLATGLYQCSLGVNFSSLSNGFGSGLTNSAPLLDSQICMEKLSGALNFDFELQVTEAAVQLVIALLSARGTEDSRKEQKTTWCNVAYDLIELLTTDEGEPGSASSKSTGVVAESEAVKALKCSPIASSRLAGLMRSVSNQSLLVILWSGFAKFHFFSRLVVDYSRGFKALPSAEGCPLVEADAGSNAVCLRQHRRGCWRGEYLINISLLLSHGSLVS